MTSSTVEAPTLVELFEPRWFADPYAYYRQLRERHPVYWDEPLGSWVVSRYQDIVALSTDERLSEDRVTPFFQRLSPAKQAALRPLAQALSDMMLFNDVPRHTALRALTRGGFSRRATHALRTAIQAHVARLLDHAGPAGHMDVVGDLSAPLTKTVIADLLGMPEQDRFLLDDWASLLHEFFTQSTAQSERLVAIRRRFDAMVAQREHKEPEDLLGHMLARLTGGPSPYLLAAPGTASIGSRRRDDVMFANFLLIIDAGQVTTTHLIPNAIRALTQFPDQLALLTTRPDLIPASTSELMRFDSSVQFTSRIATSDIEIAGEVIRTGDPVILLLASGNRDPDRFTDADRLDVTRDASAQLSFGHGAHYCLGGPLALAEIEIVLTAALPRMRSIRLAQAQLQWHQSINFRFLRRLPVDYTWIQ